MPSSCGSGFAPVAHRSCPEARFAYSRISKKQIVVCCAALCSLVQPQLRHSHASVRRHLRLWSSLPWDAFRKDRKLPRCCKIEIEWTAEACSGKAVAKQWQWLVSPGLHHTTEASAALFGVSQPRPQRSSMISMAPWHHGTMATRASSCAGHAAHFGWQIPAGSLLSNEKQPHGSKNV